MSGQGQASQEEGANATQRWALIALGTLLLCMGVSGASLWIDEGFSAKLATQPSLSSWASALEAIHGSEPQMPGYHLYLWGWGRLFGASEWAMRLANVPWAALFAASLAWGAEFVLKIRRAWLIVCLSPFVWFYMNEARPYAMVMGLAMVAIVALLAYTRDPQRFRLASWSVMVSLLALWFAHMLAITLVVSLLVLFYMLRPVSVTIKNYIRPWFRPVLITLPFYFSLALYYMHTLLSKKGGMIEKPGLPNLIFATYEFLGFGGLGPPRNVLRQHPSYHTLTPYLLTLMLGVVALGIVTSAILLRLRHSYERRTVLALSLALMAGTLLTFALSYAAHFRLLGRHLAVFFALLALILLAGLLSDGDQHRPKLVFTALLLLGIAWSVSDLRQRLLPSYQKDDYRDAASLAQNALVRGEPVLWLADESTAKYYGLQITQENTVPAFPMQAAFGHCSPEWLQHSLQDRGAVLVVMNDREDVYDPGGVCRKTVDYLNSEHVASFANFDAWQVTAAKSESLLF